MKNTLLKTCLVVSLLGLVASLSADPAQRAALREGIRNNYESLTPEQQAKASEVAAERQANREKFRAGVSDEQKQAFRDNNGWRKLDRAEERIDARITTGPKDRIEDRRDRLNIKRHGLNR